MLDDFAAFRLPYRKAGQSKGIKVLCSLLAGGQIKSFPKERRRFYENCTIGILHKRGGYSLFKLANIANDACASPTII